MSPRFSSVQSPAIRLRSRSARALVIRRRSTRRRRRDAAPASSSPSVAIMRTSCAVNKMPHLLSCSALSCSRPSLATQECHNAAVLRMCLAGVAFLQSASFRNNRLCSPSHGTDSPDDPAENGKARTARSRDSLRNFALRRTRVILESRNYIVLGGDSTA
jgi:hypothetical protein